MKKRKSTYIKSTSQYYSHWEVDKETDATTAGLYKNLQEYLRANLNKPQALRGKR